MTLERTVFRSPMASWSRNVAVFSVQVLIVAMVLHRFLSLGTPVALNLFLAALAGGVVAILLGLAAFVAIWRDGRQGAWRAAIGIGLGLAIIAWPVALIPLYKKSPAIHDITTDTESPPAFAALAAERPAGANAVAYAGAKTAKLQLAAYPDIKPLFVQRSASEAWEIMGETLRGLRWRVVALKEPRGTGRPGIYEAVDRTLILGFSDDVAVRIDGNERSARVDVRSASRYGQHDFGRNAQRVRRLLKAFEARLAATVTATDQPRRRRHGGEPIARQGKGAQGKASGR
ncbi:MAG: DUF1499 domain-containing protein [Hyphomicrobiaceae bacterium]